MHCFFYFFAPQGLAWFGFKQKIEDFTTSFNTYYGFEKNYFPSR
jgi:hypothetical protein